jgi:hypothetical protein
MPGAGFFSINASKLRFGSDGRWYADGEPVTHERLAQFFSRYVRQKAAGGYEIWVDERYHADVEVEDTPHVVTTVSSDLGAAVPGFIVHLNDGTSERLDPYSLDVGHANVLYCRVKAGTERARFLRPAYYQLANFIEEAGGGQFRLHCGSTTHPIIKR